MPFGKLTRLGILVSDMLSSQVNLSNAMPSFARDVRGCRDGETVNFYRGSGKVMHVR
jgi:hypothetical protein